VIGRFKAGKSSFLNNFLERDVLPVGVIPVTTVVTEVSYGSEEKATAYFLRGESEVVALDGIRSLIAESENPGNRKGIAVVAIELPELAGFRALRFVDMPGLESTFAHNTATALGWLPKVALALVAVSVDPPLSQHDIALLRTLYEYTPTVSILLTKVDLVSESELREVLIFLNGRLKEAFGTAPEIFPYSVRPGYEHLRLAIKYNVVEPLLTNFRQQRDAVLDRKVETLVRECRDYLRLALKAAETVESERETLKHQILGEKEGIGDLRTELRLSVQHAAALARPDIATHLDRCRSELEHKLLSELGSSFPKWTNSFAFALNSYQTWLEQRLSEELAAISAADRKDLLAPLHKLETQVFRSLQHFRDRLSEQAVRAFGVPLRTSEQEIQLHEPHTPDIYIGRIFDRSWELLSPVLPMSLLGPMVLSHFIMSEAPAVALSSRYLRRECPDCHIMYYGTSSRCPSCFEQHKKSEASKYYAAHREALLAGQHRHYAANRTNEMSGRGVDCNQYCQHYDLCQALVHQQGVSPVCWADSPEHHLWQGGEA
jgi:GTP-binding protein EngB required for normal cell division